jgi:hypothetical protein
MAQSMNGEGPYGDGVDTDLRQFVGKTVKRIVPYCDMGFDRGLSDEGLMIFFSDETSIRVAYSSCEGTTWINGISTTDGSKIVGPDSNEN